MELIANIRKKLPDFELAVNFSLSNENIALLGRSGSGKTVTLKCIAGLMTPDSGFIRLNGQTLFDSEHGINLPPQKRKTAYLFQSYALFPNMTVSENIYFITKGTKTERTARVQELLKRFALDEFSQAYPARLSGGQQQRLALARIIAAESELLLLDEPFSALDTSLRWDLELELADFLTECGKNAILVTHDCSEACHLTDKIGILDRGELSPLLSKRQLFQTPPTTTAAQLIGWHNISAARYIDEHTIAADDWGLTLSSSAIVPPAVKHLALPPAITPASTTANTFTLPVIRAIEDTHSVILLLETPAGQALHWPISLAEYTGIKKEITITIADDNFLFFAK